MERRRELNTILTRQLLFRGYLAVHIGDFAITPKVHLDHVEVLANVINDFWAAQVDVMHFPAVRTATLLPEDHQLLALLRAIADILAKIEERFIEPRLDVDTFLVRLDCRQ